VNPGADPALAWAQQKVFAVYQKAAPTVGKQHLIKEVAEMAISREQLMKRIN
jgi:hypothetical protein